MLKNNHLSGVNLSLFETCPDLVKVESANVHFKSSADCGSIGRLQESLNTSVSEVFNWALTNRLPLIEKKTKVLSVKGKRLSTKINNNFEITCNGSLLTNVMNVKLLRLEIDEELSFSGHITHRLVNENYELSAP